MSDYILDPNLKTPSDIDGQLDFFFKNFTHFLKKFKKTYKLKRIEKIIDKIHQIVRTFIQGDFFKIPLNVRGSVNEIKYSLTNDNNNNQVRERDLDSTTSDIVDMINRANRRRDLYFNELNVEQYYDNFRKKKIPRKIIRDLEQCAEKL
jgi:uncharacterized protein (UPF0147 family)